MQPRSVPAAAHSSPWKVCITQLEGHPKQLPPRNGRTPHAIRAPDRGSRKYCTQPVAQLPMYVGKAICMRTRAKNCPCSRPSRTQGSSSQVSLSLMGKPTYQLLRSQAICLIADLTPSACSRPILPLLFSARGAMLLAATPSPSAFLFSSSSNSLLALSHPP